MVFSIVKSSRIIALLMYSHICRRLPTAASCYIPLWAFLALAFWVFSTFRENGTGRQCFDGLEKYTRLDGAQYYELNSQKENSIRFWKSLEFIENGKDEYDMLLFIKR